jgi:hypothetical protein
VLLVALLGLQAELIQEVTRVVFHLAELLLLVVVVVEVVVLALVVLAEVQ